MKVLNSFIFDKINELLSFIQSKLSVLRENSLIFSNIDLLIFLSIISVYIVSTFCSNGITALFALIVPFLVTIKVLTTKKEKIELETCNLFLIIYLLICLITNFTSSMPIESFFGYSKTLLYFAFYFALCQFLKNKKEFIMPIFIVIGCLTLIQSIIGIMQNVIGVESIATWQDKSYVNPEDIITRVYGTLKPYNPNLFGGWLIACVPSLIALSAYFYYKKNKILTVVSIISLLISVLCIFNTGCRGAYVALIALIFCLLVVLFGINKQCKAIAIFIFVSASSFVLIHQSILKRLMSIFILRKDSSTSFRMNVYNSALQMFQDNPVFGIGVGNKVFREIYGLYMLSGFDALSCYSVFLEIAVESGIFALIAFILFLITLLKSVIKKYMETKDTIIKIILFVGFVSVLAVMVHGLVDTVYYRPQIQFIFWTMSAILVVTTRKITFA